MTTIERPREIWSTMPGWGIVANLTPPELIAARKLKSIRKVLLIGFAALLVVGIACYALAFLSHRSATSALSEEQARTQQLTVQQNKYQGGVRVQGSINSVQTQLGGLLANDVDQSALAGKIRAKLPSDMTINQLTMTITAGTATSGTVTGPAALDASGSTHIGNVTIGGNAKQIGDVSAYVNALSTLPGVVTPYPASSTAANGKVTWSVQLTLTGQLLTHRYDTTKIGAK